MVVIFYGTSAELIKLYTIIKLVPRDQQYLICTSQQYSGLQKVHEQLGIEPDLYLSRGWKGKDVANMKQMLGIMFRIHGNFTKKLRTIRQLIRKRDTDLGTKSLVIVHGDTLTTVVGSYLGRLLGLPIAHVEAGLRSGSWKSPFPEELDRRIAAKFSTIHFAPNDLAEDNLRRENVKGEIINTKYNTAKDAIEIADKFVSEEYKKHNLPTHYCLVLLHRTELLENKEDFNAILATLRSHADQGNNIVFTMHSTTAERIQSYNFGYILEHPKIFVIPKQPYFDFMAIVKNADCVVTDGGGLQEDSFFMGIPAIIHRARTERQEGIGFNAELSKMDVSKVEQFLASHKDKAELKKLISSVSPSRSVVNYLAEKNFITI